VSSRVAKILSLLVGASFLLTACDPPMPPEVRSALAEQSYTCESGATELHAIDDITIVATDWTSSLEANCPEMSLTIAAEPGNSTELVIGDEVSTSYLSVPFAIDATVLAVSLPDITNVALTADLVEKIWLGQITNWSDSKIVEVNPSLVMPDIAITFGVDSEAKKVNILTEWLSRLAGHKVAAPVKELNLEEGIEGSLVVADYSKVSEFSAGTIGLVSKYASDGVTPSLESLNSGASMFDAELRGGKAIVSFDPSAEPIAPAGVDVASAPYEAVWIIYLNLLGLDNLKTRAAARYLLRQDSQGSLALSNVVALPENLRLFSLEKVSVGLPEPIFTQSENE
jgi:phosphate transport system substrate-binding protein